MAIWFYAIIIPFCSFFLQSYPRFFNRLFGVDVWTRLLETDQVRRHGHSIPEKKLSGQFIIEGYFDYPPIFPWMLSFFSKKRLLLIQGFVAPFFDSLQVLFIFFLAFFFTHNIRLALLAQVMYSLTPMIALENSYLTPRSLGYLNFSLVTVSLLNFIYLKEPVFLFFGFIFATLIFLTHRFATQSFLFLTIFFTYFLNTPVFAQAFLFGFFAATLLTKGYYLRVLKGHLYNIYFWVNNLDFRFSHQVRGIIKKSKQTDWVGKIYSFLSTFSPIAVFGLNPWALSGFVFIICSWFNIIPISPLNMAYVSWILFFYFFGVIVLKVKHFMPIGEGQRYMEMATVPSVILSAWLAFQLRVLLGVWVWIGIGTLLILNLCLILFIQIKGVIRDKNRSVTNELQAVFDYINAQKKIFRIVCIPHQNTTLMIYHTKAQIFVNADNPGLMKIQEVYPILKVSLSDLAKKYNLTHALIRTSFVTLAELNLKKSAIEFQSGDVLLVRIF